MFGPSCCRVRCLFFEERYFRNPLAFDGLTIGKNLYCLRWEMPNLAALGSLSRGSYSSISDIEADQKSRHISQITTIDYHGIQNFTWNPSDAHVAQGGLRPRNRACR